MQKNANKVAFFFFCRKSKMHLSGVNKYTLVFIQSNNFSVDIVLHFSRKNGDKFNIIMPMGGCSIARISGKQRSSDINRIVGVIIAYFFRTIVF